MARGNNPSRAHVVVTMDGKAAENIMKSLENHAENLNKELEQLKQMPIGDEKSLKRVRELNKELKIVNRSIHQTKNEYVGVEEVMNNLSGTSLGRLEKALRLVKKEMKNVSEKDPRFKQLAADYRALENQINKMNNAWHRHEGAINQVMKRLVAYIGIYGAFNAIRGKVNEIVRGNLELSDSLADIQKTTGMTAGEVNDLSKAIDGLDTRSAQKELNDLAFQAGKLGITGVDNVLSFVKAGNQVLVALGEDLGGAEAIKQLMKINEVLGVTKELGIEKALLATGSAINEVGQSSTASEGYMADFAKRLGGIAAQSKLTIAQLIGLGGTTDALGQNVEVSATALNKFIVTLQTNTRDVARAAGVTDEALNKLLKDGKTMEAIIMVLEGLGKKGGLAELAPLMGDLGSEGARLTAVLTSLAGNTELLKAQLYTATQGFEEATSVTQEYNVKNNSAAAIVARMGNSIKEYFINSKLTQWLKEVLQQISYIPAWLDRNYNAIRLLTTALIAITTQLTIGRLTWVQYISVMNKADWAAVGSRILAFGKSIFSLTTYTKGLTTAWNTLGKALKTNWFGLLLTAIASVITYFTLFRDRINEVSKATKEFNVQLAKEQLELEAIFGALKRANTQTGERAALIQEINNKYGSYLGFMLSEKDSNEKLAAAQELVNAKLRERIALQLKEKMNQNAVDRYAGPLQEAISAMENSLSKRKGIGDALAGDTSRMIQESVVKNIDKDTNEILSIVLKNINDKFGTGQGYHIFRDIGVEVKGFIEAQKNIRKEVAQTNQFIETEINASKTDAQKATEDVLRATTTSFNEYYKIITDTSQSDEQVKLAKDQAIKVAREYVSVAQKYIKDNPNSTLSSQISEISNSYSKWLSENTMQSKSPWGEGLSIESASVDQLVKKYKDFFDWRKQISGDKDYTAFLSSGFKSREEEMDALMNKLNELKTKLNEMGYTEYGKFLKNPKGKSAETEASDLMSGAIAALDKYFEEQEGKIRQHYLHMESTEEGMNARLVSNEQTHLLARAELRNAFLNKQNAFSEKAYNMEHVDLEKLRSFLSKFSTMQDEIGKKRQEDINKEMELRIKRDKEIQAVAIKDDPVAQIQRDYMGRLQTLQLFAGMEINMDQEMADERMAMLTKLSEDSYKLDAHSLKKRMEANISFSDMTKDMTQDEYVALLQILRDYLTATEEAETKSRERMLRLGNRKYKQSNERVSIESEDGNIDRKQRDLDTSKKFGAISGGDAFEQEMLITQMRIDNMQREIEAREKYGADVSGLHEKLAEEERRFTDIYAEEVKRQMDVADKWGSAIGNGLGEMIAGTENAGKELVKTLLKLTVQSLAQMAQMAVMKQAMQAQEIASNMSTATANMGIATAEAVGVASTETAKATAISMSQPDSVASFGASGAARAAVIGGLIAAALAASMAIISSLFPSATKNVDTASSSKRTIYAGQHHTYATGNLDRFPILGDDGNVYNAKPTSSLKTGRYNTPHVAIFAEREPEMIISGPTTRKLMLNNPEIVRAIHDVDNGRRVRTYASGNVSAFKIPAGQNIDIESLVAIISSEVSNKLSPTLAMVADTFTSLDERLQVPLKAEIDKWGRNGLVEQTTSGQEFLRTRRKRRS